VRRLAGVVIGVTVLLALCVVLARDRAMVRTDTPRVPLASPPVVHERPAESVRASRPHETEPEPGAEIAAVFLGDVVAQGVVTLAGKPAARVSVQCVPAWFAFGEVARRGLHAAETGVDGRFVIERLPPANRYTFRIVTRGFTGTRTVSREAGSRSVDVVLRAHAVRYDRLVCVAADGRPVDLAGARVEHALLAPVLYTSLRPNDEFLEPAPFGGADPTGEPGVITVSWRGTDPLDVTLAVPGFARAAVTLEPRPVDEWPAGREVVLQPEPLPAGRMLYRVRFPADVPIDQLALRRADDPMQMAFADRRAPGFVEAEGITWTLHLGAGPEEPALPSHVEIEGHTTWIVPEIDDLPLGYATILYDMPDDPETQASLFVHGSADRPRVLYPGCARIGPLRRGTVRLSKLLLRDGLRADRSEFSFDLDAPHVEVRWP
jgi:hypothetical protein